MEEIDFRNLKEPSVKVGEVSEAISLSLDLNLSGKEILLSRRGIRHFKKYIKDFGSEEVFWNHVNRIPEIISDPDYYGLYEGNLQYIKRIDQITLVAVRVEPGKSLRIATTFPITEKQLDKYLTNRKMYENKFQLPNMNI